MAEHNEFGKLAEERAAEFLKEKGYRILARNWYWQKAEIDIIARAGNCIVIAEVKARANAFVATPEESVTKKKIRLLVTAADAFIQENIGEEVEVRFDVISVLKEGKDLLITHLENAFESIDAH